ncbi:MAG: hypothetical protein LUD81_03765 [Clostridiales bacterium]|nr:hypothetical protein [Clostridiales bacterium]
MNFDRQAVSHHEDVCVKYDISAYKDIMRSRRNIWDNESIVNAGELCYALYRAVNSNSDESQSAAVIEILEKHPRAKGLGIFGAV